MKFDPADRTSLVVTALGKPAQGRSLSTISLSNSEGLSARLEVSATKIDGVWKDADSLRVGASSATLRPPAPGNVPQATVR